MFGFGKKKEEEPPKKQPQINLGETVDRVNK
jgi:hypothetical protein